MANIIHSNYGEYEWNLNLVLDELYETPFLKNTSIKGSYEPTRKYKTTFWPFPLVHVLLQRLDRTLW